MPYSWINDCKGQTYKILLEFVHLSNHCSHHSQVENDLRLSKTMEFFFCTVRSTKIKIKQPLRELLLYTMNLIFYRKVSHTFQCLRAVDL